MPESSVHPSPAERFFSAILPLEARNFDKLSILQLIEADAGLTLICDQKDLSIPGAEAALAGLTPEGILVTIQYQGFPGPAEELARAAAENYFWPQASEAAAKQTAHLVLSVAGNPDNAQERPSEAAEAFVRIAAALMRDENVLGLYDGPVFLEPRFYWSLAHGDPEQLEAGEALEFPIQNLVWVRFFSNPQGGFDALTAGLERFGALEFMIAGDKDASLTALRGELLEAALYVIEEHPVFQNGQKLVFSAASRYALSAEPCPLTHARTAWLLSPLGPVEAPSAKA